MYAGVIEAKRIYLHIYLSVGRIMFNCAVYSYIANCVKHTWYKTGVAQYTLSIAVKQDRSHACRLGPRCDIQSVNLIRTHSGDKLKWVEKYRNLGVYLVHDDLNAVGIMQIEAFIFHLMIFCRLGRYALCYILLHLVRSKYMSVLLYDRDARLINAMDFKVVTASDHYLTRALCII